MLRWQFDINGESSLTVGWCGASNGYSTVTSHATINSWLPVYNVVNCSTIGGNALRDSINKCESQENISVSK